MDGVMISIQPKWVEKILSGEKTIEVRKTRPKLDTPFKCYIYCTKGLSCAVFAENRTYDGVGMVVAEFACKDFTYVQADIGMDGDKHLYNAFYCQKGTCLSETELFNYAFEGRRREAWCWHISDLKIYDVPKPISEFKSRQLVWRGNNHVHVFDQIKRPPQSWCYVTE